MKIIVFGGSGFLGSHVCDKLTLAGHQVTIFDLEPAPWKSENQCLIIGDILNEKEVAKAVEGAEIVFNFAGIADIGAASQQAVDTVKYNVLGNTILLEQCVKYKVKRYVFASSVYVYSKAGGFYRCSKQASELYIENFHEIYNLDYTILRYGSLYGPRADERNAIYRFVREALENDSISYYGSPDAIREYIHVEDAADCSVLILQPEYKNEHIILTGHQPMRVGEMFKMIAEMLGKPVKFAYEKNRSSAHYEITPYSFSPKVGKKLTLPLHIDLGQGVLRVIDEVHKSLHPKMHNMNGLLVKE
jgi:UDP-glucose 4-epimerase